MAEYLLSVWHGPEDPIPTDPAFVQTAFAQVDAFNAELQAAGVSPRLLGHRRSRPRRGAGVDREGLRRVHGPGRGAAVPRRARGLSPRCPRSTPPS